MKAKQICSQHEKPFVFVCSECNELLCNKCMATHPGKGHIKEYFELTDYASKILMPKYVELLEAAENRKKIPQTDFGIITVLSLIPLLFR